MHKLLLQLSATSAETLLDLVELLINLNTVANCEGMRLLSDEELAFAHKLYKGLAHPEASTPVEPPRAREVSPNAN